MKIVLISILSTLAAAAVAAPTSVNQLEPAKNCNKDLCKLPNCRCSSTEIPGGLKPPEIPQLVLLTFDDAVSITNIDYYREAFTGRKNPDGCPIGTTYFVSHEYTDYSLVHELWANGHEIALHSITHETPQEYWRDLDVNVSSLQFGDERRLVSEFAKIRSEDIQGIRAPFLQTAGNITFEMLAKEGLKYDCSWPTRKLIEPGIWPYTLDYRSIQDCPIPPCPNASIPGVWEVPMIDWFDNKGAECAMVDSCSNVPDDVNGLLDFTIENFNRQYNGADSNRAPFGFFVHAAWFDKNKNHFEAYLKFLDYLQSLKDVYLVNIQRALQWIQNPSPLGDLKESWPSCQPTHSNTCQKPLSCELSKGEETRWMKVCSSYCPDVYPWLGNPLGED